MIPSEQIMGLSALSLRTYPMMLLFRNKPPPDSSLAHNQSPKRMWGPVSYHKQTDNCDSLSFKWVFTNVGSQEPEHTRRRLEAFRADVKTSCDKS
jgi:hypothetical protein